MVDSKKHKKWAKTAVFLVIVFIVSFAGAAMAFNLFSSKEKEVKNEDGVVVKTKNTESLTTMQIVDLAQDAVVEIKSNGNECWKRCGLARGRLYRNKRACR